MELEDVEPNGRAIGLSTFLYGGICLLGALGREINLRLDGALMQEG